MKKILIVCGAIIVLAGATALAGRLLTPEDTWLCRDGQWIKHGNPSAPKPEEGCGESAKQTSGEQQLVGNDRDEHNCIGSAGYSWCESKNKCLRPWEEICLTGDEFVRSGVAAKNLPGLAKDKLYLMYEEPGKPGQKIELKFDINSVCASAASPSQRTVCMALSVSDYGLVNGRKITVIGIKEDNVLLVKEMRMEPLESGNSAWEDIKRAISSCQVTQISQFHSLEVSATLKDGRVLSAREPAIDDIMDEAAKAKPKCGNVIMATE